MIQETLKNPEHRISERFGALIVSGNSISRLISPGDLARTLRKFASILEPDGLPVIQILHYEGTLAGRESTVDERNSGQKTFTRSFEYDAAEMRFNIATRKRGSMHAVEKLQSIRFRPVSREELGVLFEKVGLCNVRLLGSISMQPHDSLNSRDIVALATKGTSW